MPTSITQRSDSKSGAITLVVEGEMLLEDALLLEKIAAEMHVESGHSVSIDLADLDFLDSDSASVLKRLELANAIQIKGMEIFLQTAVDAAERQRFDPQH
ncbi:MAG: hypothetical protein ACR2IH_06970 [Pyrinomonadaceae bacterium]